MSGKPVFYQAFRVHLVQVHMRNLPVGLHVVLHVVSRVPAFPGNSGSNVPENPGESCFGRWQLSTTQNDLKAVIALEFHDLVIVRTM